ncbi:MAG: DUF305 domain-containing protein [Beijerinckiaceae bacterium]|nr:DUF305 domain-containing protein [Beijerinckiaceae bacterium]
MRSRLAGVIDRDCAPTCKSLPATQASHVSKSTVTFVTILSDERKYWGVAITAAAALALAYIPASSLIEKQAGDAVPAPICTAPALTAGSEEGQFLAENNAAMNRMMAGMEMRPGGDIETDFAAMMTAHHQGAIDMAVIYLRYGRNERLRRIAQGIVVEQQQEIAAMRLALGLPPAMKPLDMQRRRITPDQGIAAR